MLKQARRLISGALLYCFIANEPPSNYIVSCLQRLRGASSPTNKKPSIELIYKQQLKQHQNSMDLKQLFGTILTICGAAILIFAVLIALGGISTFLGLPVDGWQAIIVGILGLIFFSTGINLIKHSNPRN